MLVMIADISQFIIDAERSFENAPEYIKLRIALALTIALTAVISITTIHLSNKAKRKKTRKEFKEMPIENMNGYQFEQYVAYELVDTGYTDVIVTKKSGDYGADIVAKCVGRKVCFQCKLYSSPVGIKAVQEVMGAMSYYGCEAGAVVSASGYTKQARNLARSANVHLMDARQVYMIYKEKRRKKRNKNDKTPSVDEMMFYDFMWED